jgi:hypothetical protein
MISEREKYERFENYLKGTMDEASKTSFEEELGSNKSFYHEFLEYQKAHNLIFESRLLDIKHELQLIHASHLKVRRFWRNTGGIIFITGLLITAVLLYRTHNRENEEKPATVSNIRASDSLPEKYRQPVFTEHTNNKILEIQHKTDTPAIKIMPSAGISAGDVKDVNVIINHAVSPSITPDLDTLVIIKPASTDNESEKQMQSVNCDQVKINCDFSIEHTCAGRSQGKILFITQTLEGGVPPYEFSINNGASYFNHALFSNLPEGTYQLLIRDGNHCTSSIGLAGVVGYECDFRFAPGLGEVWEIPFISEKEGALKILSKDGKLLYVSEVGQYHKKQWDGRTINGDLLPLGVYLFIIELADGTIYNGTITVIK